MTPVDQTEFGPQHGNCFSACVASVLDLPLGDVPFFMHDWPGAFDRWCDERGLIREYYPARLYAEEKGIPFLGVPSGHSIMSGESPRHAGVFHSVVAFDGEMVHDPNPSRAGVLHSIDSHDFIVLRRR